MHFSASKLLGALGGVISLALLILLMPTPAEAATAIKVGGSQELGPPSCPTPASAQRRKEKDKTPIPRYLTCNAFGHVTGFQIRTDGTQAVHRVPTDGRLVAWSVDLANPRADPKDGLVDERGFFESKLPDMTFDRYKARPVANIEVLKKQGRGRFKMVKKSPIVELDPWLGENPLFTLGKPLNVKKGSIVALSTPTWVPNFALANPGEKSSLADDTNLWRASRKPDRCEGKDTDGDGVIDDDSNLTELSKPHVKTGTTKKYGCVYSGAQILYKAFMVPDNRGDGGGGKKGNGKRSAVAAQASADSAVEQLRSPLGGIPAR